MSNLSFNEWLQSRLTAHGFAVGPIDGLIGTKTKNAIIAFQRSQNLLATAVADAATVAALRLPSSRVTPEVAAAIPNRDPAEESPSPVPKKNNWPRQTEVPSFYGAVGTNQVIIPLPYSMVLAWDLGTSVRRMSVHAKVAPSVTRVFQKVASIYNEKERASLGLNIFGGSLNVRRMRNGKSYSMHSWGIAIDFDPIRNSLNTHKPEARLSHSDALPFWKAWEEEGWLSLGRARNYDWMHVQAAIL